MMNIDYLDQFIHLHMNPDLDPEVLGAALAVKQIHLLITGGGSYFDHPEKESSVPPQVVEQCAKRGVMMSGPFHEYWQQLHTHITQLAPDWEQGKEQWHSDLAHATEYDELDLLLTEQCAAMSMTRAQTGYTIEPASHGVTPSRTTDVWSDGRIASRSSSLPMGRLRTISGSVWIVRR
jgi:hypothetical protein